MAVMSDSEICKRLKRYRHFLGHARHIQDILSDAPAAEVAVFARARATAYDRMLDKMIELFPDLR